jgi:hypothetical protein
MAPRLKSTPFDIPHIYGPDLLTVVRGLGYAEMENHAETILMNVASARGRSAEYFGKRRRSILFISVLLPSLDLDVLCGSLDDPGKVRAGASQPSNCHLAGVLGRELADRRPVEFVAAMGQQC